MSGDGLVRPLNAPAAGQVSPGVQPGVSPGTIVANKVIIFGANGGMFVYSGTPAAGTLIFSVTGAAGTDPTGFNAIPAGGAFAYTESAGSWFATQVGPDSAGSNSSLNFWYASSYAGPWTLGPQVYPDGNALKLVSNLAIFLFGAHGINELASGYSGYIPSAQTDIPASPTVVTAAVFTQLSTAWTYFPADAADGTIYRLTAWGDLTTPASSLQACTWDIAALGVTLGQVAIAASALAAATTYEWRLACDVIVKTAGASGVAENWITGTISEFGANLTGAGSYALTGAAGGTTVDTTASHSITMRAKWAVTESGQQVRYFGSTLERLGP